MSTDSLPAQMTALRCQSDNVNRGSNVQDVFKMEQLETPVDLEGRECLVGVRAVSLGVADIASLEYMRRGVVPGFDFAGVVKKCNSGMWQVGDRVAGMCLGGLSRTLHEGDKDVDRYQTHGGCSTFVRTKCDLVYRIPDKIELAEAATLSACLLSAYQAFGFRSRPHQNETHDPVLILGADTSLGLSAVQLAHCLGYKVIAVANAEHKGVVESYGADIFLDVTTDGLAEKFRDVTQDMLKLSMITTMMPDALTIATLSMPSGGEIAIHPFTLNGLVFLGQKLDPTRGDVVLRERVPVTLFWFSCTMDGKTFVPFDREVELAGKFLLDVTRWLEEERLKVLPYRMAHRQGVDGLLGAMEEIKSDLPKYSHSRLVSILSGGK